MKLVCKVLLLITTISGSYQTCTKFQQADLSTFDINKVIRAVSKFRNVPELFDPSSFESPAQIANDVATYNAGLNNEEAHLSMTELVQKYGYNVEEHKVITKDGYILTMFRIYGDNTKNKVVYCNHGILGSSVDYILAQEQSLPYLLAEQGYDVWLGNNRGNKYSRNHVSISPECAEFWDFSWDEMGLYDLPALIDYVLEKTDQEKLFYVGYSQGTTAFFVMASMLPEYNDKIYEMIALAPIAWMSNVKSPLLRALSINHDSEYVLLKAIGVNEVSPNGPLTKALGEMFCGNNPFSAIFCNSFYSLMIGTDKGQLNMKNLYAIFQQFPAGAATKQLQHFAQGIVSGQFRRFDYDISKNIDKYGSVNPPNYVVSNISTKINFFYSTSDWISSEKDVKKLAKNVGNLGEMNLIDKYNHLDYLWATNVKEKVYDRMIQIINNVE